MNAPGGKRILVIEDETHIAEGLKLNLSLHGCEVRIATDGVSGLQAWKEWRPDLLVLDIMLPGIDGLSVLQHIRLEDERLPILILSAKGGPQDRILGLTHGSDDYLAKPFNLEEFLLRVDRLLTRDAWHRKGAAHGKSAGTALPPQFDFGGNHIDFDTAMARCHTGSVQLTEQEVRLLKLFIAHRGKTLSRSDILKIGWGYTGGLTTRTVDNFVVRLRKYFEENPKKPVFFKSIRGVGYRFDPDAPSAP
ncbi:MAG: response regulator transcription factor [Desulfobacterales bacterium]|nr:response regulator transcription factor [Desulfobacterales bacterium]